MNPQQHLEDSEENDKEEENGEGKAEKQSTQLSKDSDNKDDYSQDSEYDDEDDLLTEVEEEKGGKKKKRDFKKRQFKLIEIQFPVNMIKAQGIIKLQWDLFIIVLAIYQAITIPISIAFNPDEFNSPQVKLVNSLIDLVFVLDIIINFRTTYIDPINGEEILDPFLIAKKYLSDIRFVIDVLSTVPLADFFESSGFLEFLGILKILRLMRIQSVIVNLNTSQETKAAFKVVYLIFTMFMYIHLMGCTWFYIVELDQVWIPNMDFIWFGTP